jgi:hypothetical protein
MLAALGIEEVRCFQDMNHLPGYGRRHVLKNYEA